MTDKKDDEHDASKLHVPIAILVGAVVLTAGVVGSYYSFKAQIQARMDERFNSVDVKIATLTAKVEMLTKEKSTAMR